VRQREADNRALRKQVEELTRIVGQAVLKDSPLRGKGPLLPPTTPDWMSRWQQDDGIHPLPVPSPPGLLFAPGFTSMPRLGCYCSGSQCLPKKLCYIDAGGLDLSLVFVTLISKHMLTYSHGEDKLCVIAVWILAASILVRLGTELRFPI
jgi:hypothetical protein